MWNMAYFREQIQQISIADPTRYFVAFKQQRQQYYYIYAVQLYLSKQSEKYERVQ